MAVRTLSIQVLRKIVFVCKINPNFEPEAEQLDKRNTLQNSFAQEKLQVSLSFNQPLRREFCVIEDI
jgi:hypothetical protein